MKPSHDLLSPNEEITITISLGSEEYPVNDLSGIGFRLSQQATAFSLEEVAWHDFPGMETDVITFHERYAGTMDYGFSITLPDGDSNYGYGDIVTVTLKLEGELDEPYRLELDDVLVIDSKGQQLNVTIDEPLYVIPDDRLAIWPGDTNNDGTVDEKDLFPIAQYYGQTGPVPEGQWIAWHERKVTSWPEKKASFADAAGSGRIDQADALVVAINYGLTAHSDIVDLDAEDQEQETYFQKRSLSLGFLNEGDVVEIIFEADEGSLPQDGMLGLSAYLDTGGLSVNLQEIQIEDNFAAALVFETFDEDNGGFPIAVSRIREQGALESGGKLFRILLEVKESAPEAVIIIDDLQASSPSALTNADFISTTPHIRTSSHTPKPEQPVEFTLKQNYPNPFNPSTQIVFTLPDATPVTLEVYDITGQPVQTLINETIRAGVHRITFDGSGLSSGIYFYRLTALNQSIIRKMILIK